ncbi:MAG TPA: putative collagen-binding domain-containing protein, partial [Candidatus Hydrogenedentes bacterium]|nr:putative collagen-binding domain-containing protein [Candidatus Hydrogenedentota bacterium]
KTVFVTEMWDNWKLTDDVHKRTFDHPERYDFVDVSQNNHNSGEKHWDNFLFAREYLSAQPRPMNTIKTYGADGNKFGHTDQDGIERFWRHLLAGAASARFHRPDSGLGLNDKAVACLRAVRKLESKIPLWSVHAANALLSDREPNAAYLAADPGKAYALYFPAGGKVTLDLSAAPGPLNAHWIDIATGEWGPVQPLEGGAKREITAPGPGNWSAAVIPRQ